jgi:hypothetical protein
MIPSRAFQNKRQGVLKVKCPLEGTFCFPKCPTICGGQIPLDNVLSRYTERSLPMLSAYVRLLLL